MATRNGTLEFALALSMLLLWRAAPVLAAAEIGPAVPCDSLVGNTYYNVTVTGATHVGPSGALPGYCKVTGTERGTQHDMEVRLPDRWRERYVQRGGGGFDGSIPPVGSRNIALSQGAAQGANNGGHRDPSGNSLLNNPRAVERYAHGAILTATRFGKAVTQAYYGKAPAYSYYEGCSNGGRGALNAAAKYGSEFNGVIAAAPTLNLAGQIAAWTSAAALQMPTREQFAAIHAAAVEKCDALDGVRDGIIARWQACRFDPATDVPASVGLTPGQREAARTLMRDWTKADGSVIYSGYGYGDMASGAPAFAMFGVGQMRNIVLNDPKWTPENFDPAASLPVISAVIDDTYQFSASLPDLVQFLRSGGKVLVWHGSDDALISHRDTIRSWQQLARAAGEKLAAGGTRLYIAPGVAHCAGGPGADTFDTLTPMMDWVERGKAPGTLVASKLNSDGATQFTRPLCQYPAYPRYLGRGDSNLASSFTCVAD